MPEFSDFEDEEGVDEPFLDEEDNEGAGENEVVEEAPLTKEIIAEALSLLCKIGNGLAHAYVRLEVHDKNITDITLLNCFIHLRYVDLSRNKLREITSLNSLTHLLTLNVSNNLLRSASMEQLPYLQTANFSNNKIMDTTGIAHPHLEMLNLNNNDLIEVTDLDAKKLTSLSMVEARGNRLTSTAGFAIPTLKKLMLGSNQIREIVGINQLEHLTTLHLRDNRVDKLDGFSEDMKSLQYINLRNNSVSDFAEVGKLKCLPMLRALVLSDNPIAEESGYRIEVLIHVRRLERLDKEPYSPEERVGAEEISEQRREEQVSKGDVEGVEVIHSDGED